MFLLFFLFALFVINCVGLSDDIVQMVGLACGLMVIISTVVKLIVSLILHYYRIELTNNIQREYLKRI